MKTFRYICWLRNETIDISARKLYELPSSTTFQSSKRASKSSCSSCFPSKSKIGKMIIGRGQPGWNGRLRLGVDPSLVPQSVKRERERVRECVWERGRVGEWGGERERASEREMGRTLKRMTIILCQIQRLLAMDRLSRPWIVPWCNLEVATPKWFRNDAG